jgi:hypothetical protein
MVDRQTVSDALDPHRHVGSTLMYRERFVVIIHVLVVQRTRRGATRDISDQYVNAIGVR